MTLLDQFDGEVPAFISTNDEPMSCINCGDPSITADQLRADGDVAYRLVTCLACDTTWQEQLSFSGISNIEIGGK